MTIYTLYVKTHRKTGLRYLGQTSKNPFEYKGSGKDWLPHLKEFGDDISTEILLQTHHKSERNRLGRYYSALWHVVTASDDFGNKLWANRIPETGGGGNDQKGTSKRGIKKPPRTKEHCDNLSKSTRGVSKPKVSESLKEWYATNPDRSESINKQSESLKKWYEDNPELAKSKSEKTRLWNDTHPEERKAKGRKISDTKIINNFDRYNEIIPLILSGHGIIEVHKLTGRTVTSKTFDEIKNGSHRVFELFPIFKKSE